MRRQIADAEILVGGSRPVLGDVNGQTVAPVEFFQERSEAGRVPLKHVIADNAQLLQSFVGNAVCRNQRLEMIQPRAAIIIHAEKRRGFAPPPAQKFVQHKTIEGVMGNFREQMIPQREFLERTEGSPVLRDADFRRPAAEAAIAPDDAARLRVRFRHVPDGFSIRQKFPFVERWKSAKQIRQRRVSVRLVEGVPQTNPLLQGRHQLRRVIHECRNRRRIQPATRRRYPRRIGKMMQHNHGRDVCRLEAIEQMDVAREFRSVQRRERGGLQARPFDAHAIGVHAEPRHPVNVLFVAVIMVAGHAAMSAVSRDIIRPFVVNMAFHLRRRRGRAPEEIFGKFQIACHFARTIC